MNIKYLTSGVLTALIAGIAVIVLAVGGGSANTRPQPVAAGGSAISIRSTPLGRTLVDANGRTLYLFAGDRANVSKLSGAGLSVWPRFIATGPVNASNGAQAAKIGTITSPSGIRQVTYNGHPLYYYVGDSAPGSTRGQGINQFGALWYALGPGGSAVTNSPSSSTAAPASSSPAPSYSY
jgi:predicted lipoprotein with Yx(FWY)xxD motif